MIKHWVTLMIPGELDWLARHFQASIAWFLPTGIPNAKPEEFMRIENQIWQKMRMEGIGR